MPDRDPLQTLWISQTEEEFSMSLAEIRTRAKTFSNRIRTRNFIEYAAAALVIGSFAAVAFFIPEPVSRAGAILIALGSLYVCWRLHVQARAEKHEELGGVAPWIEAHRAQMVRQRDALKSVWSWYLGPLVPGMVLFWTGVMFARGGDLPLILRIATSVIGLGIVGVIFWGIAQANIKAAQFLQKEIDALDRARNA